MNFLKYPEGEGERGGYSLRCFGIALILHLLLQWARGMLLELVEYLFSDDSGMLYIYYVAKALLTVGVGLLPVFLYLKLMGKRVAALVHPREDPRIYRVQRWNIGCKIVFFVFAAAITLNIANFAGVITDVVYDILGKRTETSILIPEIRTLLLTLLSSVILAPILEELLFRGVALNALSPYGVGWSVILSGVFFALMHLNTYSLLYAFCAGCAIAFFAYLSNSLWVAVGLHFVNNLLTFCSMYVESRYGFAAAEHFGYILLAVTLPIAVIGVLFFAKKKIWRASEYGDANDVQAAVQGPPIGIEMVIYAATALFICLLQ